MVAAVPKEYVLATRDVLRWPDLRDEIIYVQEWPQSHAMREFYASMIGIGVPFQAQPAGKQTLAEYHVPVLDCPARRPRSDRP
jgi:hypothetical protein